MTTDRASLNQAFRSPWILGLLALAILLRLFALILAWGTEPIGDPLNYLRLAHNLLAGDGLSLPRTAIGPELVSTALFPPGLPLVLAAVGLVAPLNAATLFLLDSLIDCTAALLLARLARLLGAPQIAVPAALAYLLWPSIALMSPLAYRKAWSSPSCSGRHCACLNRPRAPVFDGHWAAGYAPAHCFSPSPRS